MWMHLSLMLALPAAAETLPVNLGTQVGALYTPIGSEVGLELKGATDGETATWKNIESSALSFRCATDPLPPSNEIFEQVVLQVGEKKWALAPGSTVAFTCGEGKTVTVTDLHGRTIAAFPKSLSMLVASVRASGR
jgi:hypothetical protein